MSAPVNPAARPARGPTVQVGPEGGWQKTVQGLVKSVAMFVGLQMVMRYGMQYMGINNAKPAPSAPASANVPGSTGAVVPPTGGAIDAEPAWPLGTPLSMLLFTSTSPTGSDLNLGSPLVAWDNMTYGGSKDEREADLILDVPQSVRSENGSWWMDVVLVKGGGQTLIGKEKGEVAMYRKQLTRFLPKRRIRKEKKLIRGDEPEPVEEEPVEQPAQLIVAHWSRNLTLTIVNGGGPVNLAGLPAQVAPHYGLAPSEDGAVKQYYPPMFPNDFWILRENLDPINETSMTLPLHVNYHALSGMKFTVFASMTQSFEQAAQQQGTGAEMDEMKRMLTETNPYLLVTTAIVTVLHMVFEFLAFSSDVSHWRKKDRDLVGVSLNTILTNCFVQLVILLYLHDSSEETSFMILFGQGIGLLIEAWKITKVVNVRVREAPGTLIGYKVTFEGMSTLDVVQNNVLLIMHLTDKKVLSEDEKKTQEYDALAFRLVGYAAFPMLAGYTIYSRQPFVLHPISADHRTSSVLYETHRGWWSFIITTLAQAIYMFGFVQLVPQLIINYKLKSVAHMPMKAMMYKTLSTVVDDFFLACFRDDAVFVILLYQRWIYRIDYSRINEYGQINEGMVEPVGEKDVAEKLESKKDK